MNALNNTGTFYLFSAFVFSPLNPGVLLNRFRNLSVFSTFLIRVLILAEPLPSYMSGRQMEDPSCDALWRRTQEAPLCFPGWDHRVLFWENNVPRSWQNGQEVYGTQDSTELSSGRPP